jgi:PAS domain S-box-containing protein
MGNALTRSNRSGPIRLRRTRPDPADEERVRDSEQRFRELLMEQPVPASVAEDGRILHHNRKLTETFGYTVADTPTLEAWFRACFPDPQERARATAAWTADFNHARDHGQGIAPREYLITCKDGTRKNVIISGQFISTQLITTLVDVTEARTLEADLLDSRTKLAALIESTDDMIWSVDLDNRIQTFNSSLAEHIRSNYGFELQVGSPSLEHLPPDRGREMQALYERARLEGPFQTELELPDGRTLELHVQPVHQGENLIGHSVFGKDITARKAANLALRSSENRLREIVERAPMGIFRRTAAGPFVTVNQGLIEQLECRDLADLMEHFGELSQRWARPEDYQRFQAILAAEGKVEAFEVETRLPSGKTKWFLLYVYRDARAPEFSDGFSVDVTALKEGEFERQRIMESLHHSQKMDAIGRLAGGVAHDLNNMLAGIMACTEVLQIRPESLSEERRAASTRMILDAAQRAADLTKKLLAFSRKANRSSAPLDVLRMIEDTVAILRRTLDKKIQIIIEANAPCTTVIGDESMLHSVFLNLGINASHAMAGGGTLTFSLRNTFLDELECSASPFEVAPGRYLEIEVRDTGCGMSPEVQARIFEPFFTTKPTGSGTGLGLAAAYGTIQDLRGMIKVYSEVGVGSVFRIDLPLTATSLADPAPHSEPVTGSGTILLVEDEDLLRNVIQSMLEQLGYVVLTATDGRQGVEAFRQAHATLDLVVLDMIMPVMGGREAFEFMASLDPGVPVLLSSGFSKEEDLVEMRKHGLAGFIQKPFRMLELSRVIAATIRPRPAR